MIRRRGWWCVPSGSHGPFLCFQCEVVGTQTRGIQNTPTSRGRPSWLALGGVMTFAAGSSICYKYPQIPRTFSMLLFPPKLPKPQVVTLDKEQSLDYIYGQREEDTPLHRAVKNRSLKEVEEILLSAAGDKKKTEELLEAKGSERISALYVAVDTNQLEIAKVLLKHGSKVDNRGRSALKSYPTTPLFRAAKNNNGQMIELLLSPDGGGAKINETNILGATALHTVATAEGEGKSHVDAARALLKLGAIVDQKDAMSGKTPLHWASENNHLEMVKFLVKNGADKTIRDKVFSKTPLEIAVGDDVKEFLQK